MTKTIFTSAIIFLITTGCSSTGVVPMSQDSYFIGKKDGSPGIGVSLSNKAAVYREANEFCSKKNLEVQTLDETVIPAAPGRLGSTELHFKCVQQGGAIKPIVKDTDKDMYTELNKLKELKDSGIITQEEFDTEKKQILLKY